VLLCLIPSRLAAEGTDDGTEPSLLDSISEFVEKKNMETFRIPSSSRMKAIFLALMLSMGHTRFFASCFVQIPSISACQRAINARGHPLSTLAQPPLRNAARITAVSMAAVDGKETAEKVGAEQALLWADGLSKTYDGIKYQFKSASFVLSRGERAGLIGVNGVGESMRMT
jgi:hypothetical protein